MDVFKPLNVCLGEAFRNKLCFAGCNGFHGRAGKRVHLDEPLRGCHRFYDRLAAGAVSDSMLCFFNLYLKTGILQILNDGFSGFITVHAVVLAGLFVHRAVLVHDDDGLKIVAASHLKVVRVMRRSNLDAACAVCHIYIIISNDRNFTVCCRKFYLLAYKMGISFIIWIDSNGCIPRDCFRTCRCNLDISVFTDDRVIEIPKMSDFILMFYFDIRKGSLASRAPVCNSESLINQALFI